VRFAFVAFGSLLVVNMSLADASEVAWVGKAGQRTKVGSKCQVEIPIEGVGVSPGSPIANSAGRVVGTCARVVEKLRPWYGAGDRRVVCVGTVKESCAKLAWTKFSLTGESCFPVVRSYGEADRGTKCRVYFKVAANKETAAKRCQPTDRLRHAGVEVMGKDLAFDGSGGAAFVDARTCAVVKAARRIEQAALCAEEAAERKKQRKIVLGPSEQAPAGKCPRGTEALRVYSWGNPHECDAFRVCIE
jgi:hypothetical protein